MTARTMEEMGYSHINQEHYIYGIFNTVTGGMYLGSTNDIDRRGKEHFSSLRNGGHYNKKLQRSFNKHGESVFELQIIQYVNYPFDRHEAEQKLLDEMSGFYKLYNIRKTCHPQGAFTEKSISAAKAKVGIARSPEVCEKIRISLTGRKRPQHVIEKVRASLKGRPHPRPNGWVHPKATIVPEKDRVKIIEMRIAGMLWREIASDLGYSIGVITRIKGEMKLWSRPSKLAKLKFQK